MAGVEGLLDGFRRQNVRDGDPDEPAHDRRGQRHEAQQGVERQIGQDERQAVTSAVEIRSQRPGRLL